MEMWVKMEHLSPGVQHRDGADLGAKVAGIGGDGAQGLRRRAEQNGVDGLLVVESDFGDRRRHGEHDVEVGDRQQFGLTRLQPLGTRQALAFWTVAVAAGNGRCPLPALWAKPVMGSWRSR